MTSDITPLVNEHCQTGENPFYVAQEHSVYWVDIPPGKLFRLDLQTGAHRLIYHDVQVGGFTRQESGDLLLFRVDDIARMQPDGTVTSLLPFHDEGAKRFNDVIADPMGRVFAGTIGQTNDSGGLWRVERDGTMELMFRGTGCANGMAFSLDQRTFYWTDTTNSQIFRFDFDAATGRLSNRELWYRAAPEAGRTDGLALDANGNIWSAHNGGGCVLCLSPQGREIGRLEIPVRKPTSCIFGGRDMDTLFITTGGGKPDLDTPDGTLYAAQVDAKGTPEFASRILI